MNIPHLTDRESVREEAAQQYGGLNDAAQFVQAWTADRDPNVSSTALRRVNVAETEKVQGDLDSVQKRIDKEVGEGWTVLDAVVRGDALSAVIEDNVTGRTKKVVLGYTDRFRPVQRPADAEAAAANAEAEAAVSSLGAEARAMISNEVKSAVAEVLPRVQEELLKAIEKVNSQRDERIKSVTEDDEAQRIRESQGLGEQKPGSGSGSGKSPEDKSRTTRGGRGGGSSQSKGGSDDDRLEGWPTTHDELDALAEEHGVEFTADDKTVAQKQHRLAAEGVEPDAGEE